MRRGYLFLLFGSLLALNVHAQLLQVKMVTDRNNFLPNQAVVVKLVVRNVSGQKVMLADGGRLGQIFRARWSGHPRAAQRQSFARQINFGGQRQKPCLDVPNGADI